MITHPETFFEQFQNFIEESGLQLKKFKSSLSNYFTKSEAIDTFLGKTDQAESAKKSDEAIKATQDSEGNIITSTYATKTEVTKGLAGKANASHTHTSADVTDLNVTISNALKPYATTNTVNTELDKKANKSHTHTVSQITDMPKAVLSVNNITPASGGNVNLGLHAVATSGNYNDLANKPSIPATPKAYVISTWSSGASWYRAWSDGFIEQGGVTSASTEHISLHTVMSSSNYVVTIAQRNAHDTWSTYVYGRENTYFTLSNAYNSGVCWYVAGY